MEEATKFLNRGIARNERGEVLLVRLTKEEEGKDGAVLRWIFPGGNLRITESRADCVKRNVLRQTGYDVKVIRQISLRPHPQFLVHVAYHLCKLNAPEPAQKPNGLREIAEVRWVRPSEVLELITTDIDPDVKSELGLK